MNVDRSATERRRSRRRPVLNSFSLFIVIPEKGVHRLQIHDVSDIGMGFNLDTEGEMPDAFPVSAGQRIDVRFYLNQSLYLPLTLEVVRVEQDATVRKIGAEFRDENSKGYKAFLLFLEMLDGILDVVRLDPQGQAASQSPPA